jgi:hypothetical protein
MPGRCRDFVKIVVGRVKAASRTLPPPPPRASTGHMADVIYLGLTGLLFGALTLVLRAVERL